MCISPVRLANGSMVSCNKCWQCRENRVRDWTGRCIAESKTAIASHAVTLTYGRDEHGSADHLRAAVLTYSDVQKYLKRLRKAGFPCRYLVAGEYGSLKGRAHWHIIMYWLKAVPPHELRVQTSMAHRDFWPHGHTYWDEMTPEAVRYVCKYIQKDHKPGAQAHWSLSKKPPIGTEFFRQLARQHVAQGLSPQNAFYRFPGINDAKGKPQEFMLSGATLDEYCHAFLTEWERKRGGFYPHSDLVESYLDRMAKRAAIFPLVHPLALEAEKYTVVTWDEKGEGTWHERERDVTLKERWQQQHPGVPYPGRFERGRSI